MSEPGESPSIAQNRYEQFLKNQMNLAIKLEKKGQHNQAIYALGLGMHAIADSASPSHSGNQPWDGTDGTCNKIKGIVHVSKELYPNRAQTDDSSLGLQNYYNEFTMKSHHKY